MRRFFSPSQNKSGDKIIISDKIQVHHVRNVLRLKIGDEVIIFDDSGNEYRTVIEKLLPKSVIVKIRDSHKFILSQKRVRITVACAIPKKSKMDDIVDKLTQLGVDRIIPLVTERVIIKLTEDKEMLRLARWRKIALSSAKQSQRNKLPIIDSVKELREVLSGSATDFDLKLIPTLMGKRKSLKEIFIPHPYKDAGFIESKPKNVLVVIGPEGDFTEQEIILAKENGFIPVSLGNLVLRVETACVAVASFIRFYLYGNR